MTRAFSHSLVLFALLAVACGGSESKDTDKPIQPADDDEQVEVGDRDRGTHRPRTPEFGDDDDDDEPGLDVKGLKGRLDPHDIQNGVQPHAGALTACYSDKVRRRRYVGGNIVLKFTVAKTGDVKTVQLAKSDLGAWDVEKCMLDVSRGMTFVKPKGGEADFTLPLNFSETKSVRWLEEEAGMAQVKEFLPELRACAKESKTRNPRAVYVTVYVGARGVVKSVGFASDHKRPIPDEWADCADAKVKAWVLADPLGRVAKLAFRYN